MVSFIFLLLIPAILSFMLITLIVFPPVFVAFFLPLSIRPRFMGKFWAIFSRIMLKYICFAEITYIDRRPLAKQKGPMKEGALYICNHQSLFDIPLFATKHSITPLMKQEVAYIPIVGIISLASGSITVKRRNTASRRKALMECLRRLQMGIPILYYPEGTRSADAFPKPVEKIHRPLLERAYSLNIPVVPLSVYGTDKILSKNQRLVFRQKIGLVTHHSVLPGDFKNSEEFINFCWGKVIEGHRELDELLQKNKSKVLSDRWGTSKLSKLFP